MSSRLTPAEPFPRRSRRAAHRRSGDTQQQGSPPPGVRTQAQPRGRIRDPVFRLEHLHDELDVRDLLDQDHPTADTPSRLRQQLSGADKQAPKRTPTLTRTRILTWARTRAGNARRANTNPHSRRHIFAAGWRHNLPRYGVRHKLNTKWNTRCITGCLVARVGLTLIVGFMCEQIRRGLSRRPLTCEGHALIRSAQDSRKPTCEYDTTCP